jgi:hypothetical protein
MTIDVNGYDPSDEKRPTYKSLFTKFCQAAFKLEGVHQSLFEWEKKIPNFFLIVFEKKGKNVRLKVTESISRPSRGNWGILIGWHFKLGRQFKWPFSSQFHQHFMSGFSADFVSPKMFKPQLNSTSINLLEKAACQMLVKLTPEEWI